MIDSIPSVRLDEVQRPGHPTANAVLWLKATANEDGLYIILYHRKSFHNLQGTHWSKVSNDGMRSTVALAFEHAFYFKPRKNGPPERVEFSPTNAKLREIMGALKDLTYVPDDSITGVTS